VRNSPLGHPTVADLPHTPSPLPGRSVARSTSPEQTS
jgi:hypothetical protein